MFANCYIQLLYSILITGSIACVCVCVCGAMLAEATRAERVKEKRHRRKDRTSPEVGIRRWRIHTVVVNSLHRSDSSPT